MIADNIPADELVININSLKSHMVILSVLHVSCGPDVGQLIATDQATLHQQKSFSVQILLLQDYFAVTILGKLRSNTCTAAYNKVPLITPIEPIRAQ